MLLNSAIESKPILSNVGSVSQFSIKATGKSFQILSAGLYADKILAIVRELSCNAKDSHVAAGCADRPFELHLPTSLEPWFSIRDFGTGLTNDQVVNIYTTYFESTKTGSNDFIGALGLGSKTPFSYTTNFTVVAIKDGKKGVYTAYINEHGVPSIALMCEEESAEEPGVEIKFPVEDRYDFDKFVTAASLVFRYFEVLPKFTGRSVNIDLPQYETRDIIPGVSVFAKRGYGRSMRSVAVMGNIAYPIQLPNVTSEDSALLDCSLELRFNIGDLDIQASREGLSYIPSTVDAITSKLSALRAVLYSRLTDEANSVTNLWERAELLRKKHSVPLWSKFVVNYINDTKFPLLRSAYYGGIEVVSFEITAKRLADEFNIWIDGFVYGSSTLKPTSRVNGIAVDPTWSIKLDADNVFVINDLKTGAMARARHHAKTNGLSGRRVYVLNALDKTKPMLFSKLFAEMYSPPKSTTLMASTLDKKPRAEIQAANASILRLDSCVTNRRTDEYTWTDVGKLSSFDSSETYYYLPLAGFAVISKTSSTVNAKELVTAMRSCGFKTINGLKVYGVRKKDLEAVKARKNWVNLETELSTRLAALSVTEIEKMAIEVLDDSGLVLKVKDAIPKTSPYSTLITLYSSKTNRYSTPSVSSIAKLDSLYGTGSVAATVKQKIHEFESIRDRYPLLCELKSTTYVVNTKAVVEYINLIDATK